MAKKILFIVGSLRKRSFNRQLAEKAAEIVRGRADVSFLEWADVPLFSQDGEFPAPAPVARVRKEVQEADGIWIFSPEYNGAVPGALKNLLDWLSRPLVSGDAAGGTAAAGKKATVSGAGGKNATRSVRADLQKLLSFMRMEVLCADGSGFSADAEAFQTDTLRLQADDIARLEAQAAEFLAAV